MEERLCSQCGKPLPSPAYRYGYCPVCRSLMGIDERSDLAEKHRIGKNVVVKGFPPKGRDRLAERLRDGFEMIDDDDS